MKTQLQKVKHNKLQNQISNRNTQLQKEKARLQKEKTRQKEKTQPQKGKISFSLIVEN